MSKKIKEMGVEDRPREKLLKFGTSQLNLKELLSIIIGSGNKDFDVVSIANKIFSEAGKTVTGLTDLTIEDLRKIKGLGEAKTAKLMAAIEIGKRAKELVNQDLSIHSARDVWEAIPHVRTDKQEHFVVIYMDSRNRCIKHDTVFKGTLNASMVHPREVFACAVSSGAASIMLAHNHPSGSLEPSEADIATTRRLVECGQLMGIEVVDHIIVTKDEYSSLRKYDPDIFD